MNRLLIVLVVSGLAEAHSGSRLYPFYELTDEMLETIDIHDGLIDEWYEIGEPSMTLLDFQVFQNRRPLDPSNLDFRIWLAWHDEPDRIYAAFIIADDEYRNVHDYNSDSQYSLYDHDSVVLQLDADHSGGTGRGDGWDDFSGEKFMRLLGETQRYSAVARTVSGPILDNHMRADPGIWTSFGIPDSWKVRPPYGDAGGMAAGESPTVSVIEMYVTPYDWWDAWDDVTKTGFSELSAHQIIGFCAQVIEKDCAGDCEHSGYSWHPSEIEENGSWLDLYGVVADIFVDGLLLPAQDTAVESATWGRIKASLE